MKTEPPLNPNDMPSDWHNNAREIRDAILSLSEHSYVDIHWERDDAATDATGETVGEWSILIGNGRLNVKSNHPSFTNALWFATQMMDAQNQAAYEARAKTRANALAKLTPEDRKALGLPLS